MASENQDWTPRQIIMAGAIGAVISILALAYGPALLNAAHSLHDAAMGETRSAGCQMDDPDSVATSVFCPQPSSSGSPTVSSVNTPMGSVGGGPARRTYVDGPTGAMPRRTLSPYDN